MQDPSQSNQDPTSGHVWECGGGLLGKPQQDAADWWLTNRNVFLTGRGAGWPR